ncbi:putative secreted protein with PEP-CTERM sorting signal [Nitrosospira sp. Nsp5]|uniref:PEP-CTERM protein-sorting domain-containing protein n=1 Tax=Nitrosospira multiformis TaxID=1231 RepID=A0ABY0TIP7_9PROT|nr:MULTISPECIES: CHRD domain-containing protein [Nitrosospira]PTR08927.1 putative secreted protein with PEP-CTERM sorting signal [Nitrosospira sp. Nsp5]SDQ67117.1 PEP-CTERM protein-sorting domain-containing protein [Nitrosospira multiformis]
MKLSTLFAGCLFASVAAMPAAAHQIVYTTSLDGPSEAPPNISPGTGTAKITVDFDLVTMRVEESFSGLQGNVTASHIHCCTAVPGAGTIGVATTLPTFTDFPSGVTSGTYDRTFDMTDASSYNPAFVTANGSVGGAFNALVAGLDGGTAYANIHTNIFPAGEIRGFLAPIPEPEAYAMLLAGLGMIGAVARRRRG